MAVATWPSWPSAAPHVRFLLRLVNLHDFVDDTTPEGAEGKPCLRALANSDIVVDFASPRAITVSALGSAVHARFPLLPGTHLVGNVSAAMRPVRIFDNEPLFPAASRGKAGKRARDEPPDEWPKVTARVAVPPDFEKAEVGDGPTDTDRLRAFVQGQIDHQPAYMRLHMQHFEVLVVAGNPDRPCFTVQVKTETGEGFPVAVERHLSLGSLQLCIQELEGTTPDQQLLVCRGRHLKDPRKALADYDIGSMSEVHLLRDCRSGDRGELGDRGDRGDPCPTAEPVSDEPVPFGPLTTHHHHQDVRVSSCTKAPPDYPAWRTICNGLTLVGACPSTACPSAVAHDNNITVKLGFGVFDMRALTAPGTFVCPACKEASLMLHGSVILSGCALTGVNQRRDARTIPKGKVVVFKPSAASAAVAPTLVVKPLTDPPEILPL